MTTAVTKTPAASAGLVEQVLIKGDLASLTPAQRVEYYTKVCESVGLNPLTKPFEYITLNNKLTLYALRGCTDQLRGIHKVSVTEMVESERDGVYIVTVKVANGEGRTDMAKGAVNIGGLKGEALANSFMKAETKAKRRATLSLCGLGFLDETEVETIAGAKIGEPPAVIAHDQDPDGQVTNWCDKEKQKMAAMTRLPELLQWQDEREAEIKRLFKKSPALHRGLMDYFQTACAAVTNAQSNA